ncbi:MAG: RluA family pseudouridine synthase [Planctomycetota bacterium]|nr:RluA family pseudouridine synthase [Planctomycetota bacterium]
MTVALDVLYEDNHLLVVNKPANLPTMGATQGKDTLAAIAKGYLKAKYNKPGNAYVGVVSRLDAVVTGVIVLARTSKAAKRLTEQFRHGDVAKEYWAVVEQRPQPASAQCVNWIRKNEQQRRMVVVKDGAPGAREARLRYSLLQDNTHASALRVFLETGRKHQIRVQLSHRGHPILGDHKYGSQRNFAPGIALHARSLGLQHPVRKVHLDFLAPLPLSWHPFQLE